MLGVAFPFGRLGAAGASRPRATVTALAVWVAVSYFTQQLTPLFDWPDGWPSASPDRRSRSSPCGGAT